MHTSKEKTTDFQILYRFTQPGGADYAHQIFWPSNGPVFNKQSKYLEHCFVSEFVSKHCITLHTNRDPPQKKSIIFMDNIKKKLFSR